MLQQHCQHRHVYVNHGDHVHQCGHSLTVLRVDARVGVDERFHYCNVRAQHGVHERRITSVVLIVDIGAFAQQILDHVELLMIHGCLQHGHARSVRRIKGDGMQFDDFIKTLHRAILDDIPDGRFVFCGSARHVT